jgi:hypothetical protein
MTYCFPKDRDQSARDSLYTLYLSFTGLRDQRTLFVLKDGNCAMVYVKN